MSTPSRSIELSPSARSYWRLSTPFSLDNPPARFSTSPRALPVLPSGNPRRAGTGSRRSRYLPWSDPRGLAESDSVPSSSSRSAIGTFATDGTRYEARPSARPRCGLCEARATPASSVRRTRVRRCVPRALVARHASILDTHGRRPGWSPGRPTTCAGVTPHRPRSLEP